MEEDEVAEIERRFHRGDQPLDRHVHEALSNAVENGYDMRSTPSSVLAMNLSECDAGCQGLSMNVLIPHIDAWKQTTTDSDQ